MDMKEAMKNRHTVRKYQPVRLPEELAAALNARVEANNSAYGLHIRLMVDNGEAVGAAVKLLLAKGVKNYLILAGDESAELEEKLGYCAADLMLYAQTLGLNSWYIGSMFNRGVERFVQGKKAVGVVAVGYGRTQGTPHRSKSAAEVSRYEGDAPAWFTRGVEASLLAPTALNKQDYFLTGRDGRVRIENDNGKFTGVNRGLLKYHFELGAGADSFVWE